MNCPVSTAGSTFRLLQLGQRFLKLMRERHGSKL
jgi:hypothetical protein